MQLDIHLTIAQMLLCSWGCLGVSRPLYISRSHMLSSNRQSTHFNAFFQWSFFFLLHHTETHTHLTRVHCGWCLCSRMKQLLFEGRVEWISTKCLITFNWRDLEAHKYKDESSEESFDILLKQKRVGFDYKIAQHGVFWDILWHMHSIYSVYMSLYMQWLLLEGNTR